MTARIYADRAAAGIELAGEIVKRKLRGPVLVLGLPRGGVPVAYEVARALGAPLDVMVVRKIGMPGQPELAIGAIASGDVLVREPRLASEWMERAVRFEELVERERGELERREHAYRAGLPPLDLRNQTVVLVDDGVATGSTMLAAVRAARKAGAATVIVAAPVAAPEAADLLAAEADGVVILQVPAFLFAIGQWYERFEQLEDEEVQRLLKSARTSAAAVEKSAARESGLGRT